jgi:hypothetical protein
MKALVEAVHDRPAPEQVATGEDHCLRPHPRAPSAVHHIADSQPQARVVGVRVQDAQGDWVVLPWRELAVEPAPDQLRLLGAVAALGEEVRRALPRPTAVAAGIEQYEVGQRVGIAQRVLERHVPAERVAQHRPPFESQPLAQRVGVRREVLPGHGRHGNALRPSIAAVVDAVVQPHEHDDAFVRQSRHEPHLPQGS